MHTKKLMMLADVAYVHGDELRADLQETYGIDIDRAMAGAHSPVHVAALTAQLPPDARVRIAENKDSAWTLRDIILIQILNEFRSFEWGMSDPRKRGAAPRPIGPSWLADRHRKSLPARAMPVDELMEELSKPRR